MDSFLDQTILEWSGITLALRGLIAAVVTILAFFLLYRILYRFLLPMLFYYQGIERDYRKKIRISIFVLLLLGGFSGLMWSLHLDYDLIPGEQYNLYIATLVQLAMFIVLARVLDTILSKIFELAYDKSQQKDSLEELSYDKAKKPGNSIQAAVYILVLIFIMRNFNWDLEITRFQGGDFILHVSDLFFAVLIFIFARLIAWVLTKILMRPYYKNRGVDVGTQYAVNQLITYVIFVVAFFVAIESLGVRFAVLWGSAAALLVGVGLGLQQTFNDLTSGIILLFERSIEVGNVVDLQGTVGIVRKIGLRTSQVESRDNIVILVPNSHFIVDEVVNWSHFDDKARFQVHVGVAYGSDTSKVREILLKVARENAFILDQPAPSVNFTDFGDSSLDFILHFWSRNFMYIERVKSDLRYEIDKAFREGDVTIPFPQRDLWVKSLPAEKRASKSKG